MRVLLYRLLALAWRACVPRCDSRWYFREPVQNDSGNICKKVGGEEMRDFIETVILFVVFAICAIYILFFWKPLKNLRKKGGGYE